MTTRLYYTDAYRTRFSATVVERADDGKRVYLDETAFYPTSGGQPHDLGTLNGVEIVDVVDEDDRIAHVLSAPLPDATSVEGAVDWARRYDLMQQHTGQHLLSAVFEDLLPFSNEALVRAVAAARTPVVSAIGHDEDTPLLDFVADVRASTPTDAAKRIVPDLADELDGLAESRARGAGALHRRLIVERRHLEQLRSRPVLVAPETMVATRRATVEALRDRSRSRVGHRLERAHDAPIHRPS